MLKTLYGAFANRDMERVIGLLTDDIEFLIFGRNPVSGSYSGKNEILRFFGKLGSTYGDTFRLDIQDILVNDKHGVVLTLERAQHRGEPVENRAVHVYDIRGGKCARCRAYNEDAWDEFWYNNARSDGPAPQEGAS
jgi:ketosteroid isomerase-like protein